MFISSTPDLWSGARWTAPVLEYAPARQLFQQGSPGDAVYLIQRGLVKLESLEPEGHGVVIGLLSHGTPLGAVTVVLEMEYVASAITLTPCLACRIPAGLFRQLLRSDAQVSWQFHQWCSREMHWGVAQQMALKTLPARQRLEQCLWELVSFLAPGDSRGPVGLSLPLRHWELAQLIGVTPEHLCRMLSQLEQTGMLRRARESLTIREPRKLWHRADDRRFTSSALKSVGPLAAPPAT